MLNHQNIYLFKLNLLGWYWQIKLYRFQVYSSITHLLYIVFTPASQVSFRCHLPARIPSYPLLHPLPPTFPSGKHHIIACIYEGFFRHFFFCIMSSLFAPSPVPTSLRAVICSLYMSLFLFCLLVCLLDSTCKWIHMVFVFLCLACFI